MRNLLRILPIILFPFTSTGIYAQLASAAVDETYGFDPLLYNGKFYTYSYPSVTKGTPFFNGPDFVIGSVNIRGIMYDSLSLKYDVFNQQLVLQYQKVNKGVLHIVLSEAWLEDFFLGDAHFKLVPDKDSINHIYQVLGNGSKQLFYSWTKKKSLDTRYNTGNDVFSEPMKKMYLVEENNWMSFKNNKSFLALFNASDQRALKKYFSRQKIKVNKASDASMVELINYINTLSHQ